MTDTGTIRTIVGIIGNVISFALFLSPLPTFIKIFKEKSVMQFRPDPYVATVLNCAVWVFYGMPFVHPNSTLVITINGCGLVLQLIYVCIFLIYAEWPTRRKILIALIIEVIFLVIIIAITMTVLHGTNSRSMLVGIIAVIFNIGMYAAPLTVMRRVISTKSVQYMPLTLSIANFANGAIWFAYAFLEFDPYILIPNGLGMLSGIVQLILYATYYKTTNWDDDGKPTEIELSDNSRV